MSIASASRREDSRRNGVPSYPAAFLFRQWRVADDTAANQRTDDRWSATPARTGNSIKAGRSQQISPIESVFNMPSVKALKAFPIALYALFAFLTFFRTKFTDRPLPVLYTPTFVLLDPSIPLAHVPNHSSVNQHLANLASPGLFLLSAEQPGVADQKEPWALNTLVYLAYGLVAFSAWESVSEVVDVWAGSWGEEFSQSAGALVRPSSTSSGRFLDDVDESGRGGRDLVQLLNPYVRWLQTFFCDAVCAAFAMGSRGDVSVAAEDVDVVEDVVAEDEMQQQVEVAIIEPKKRTSGAVVVYRPPRLATTKRQDFIDLPDTAASNILTSGDPVEVEEVVEIPREYPVEYTSDEIFDCHHPLYVPYLHHREEQQFMRQYLQALRADYGEAFELKPARPGEYMFKAPNVVGTFKTGSKFFEESILQMIVGVLDGWTFSHITAWTEEDEYWARMFGFHAPVDEEPQHVEWTNFDPPVFDDRAADELDDLEELLREERRRQQSPPSFAFDPFADEDEEPAFKYAETTNAAFDQNEFTETWPASDTPLSWPPPPRDPNAQQSGHRRPWTPFSSI